ncbi:hypothetical protein SAMD00023353_3800200 [Rosellinia necatrix]|uniref:Uncharacterized protein n=1 Tax=Rosellinia necatrix TaxID=77044 RepID=A0A1S8AA52_ROSNE|nr:hypothetical protein SAMD00023353_3800200 [Rosellinia necatrix]
MQQPAAPTAPTTPTAPTESDKILLSLLVHWTGLPRFQAIVTRGGWGWERPNKAMLGISRPTCPYICIMRFNSTSGSGFGTADSSTEPHSRRPSQGLPYQRGRQYYGGPIESRSLAGEAAVWNDTSPARSSDAGSDEQRRTVTNSRGGYIRTAHHPDGTLTAEGSLQVVMWYRLEGASLP